PPTAPRSAPVPPPFAQRARTPRVHSNPVASLRRSALSGTHGRSSAVELRRDLIDEELMGGKRPPVLAGVAREVLAGDERDQLRLGERTQRPAIRGVCHPRAERGSAGSGSGGKAPARGEVD